MINHIYASLSWRAYVRHPWQSLLSIVGVALGVAVVIAIAITSQSARLGFDRALSLVNGNTTHQILAGAGGVDEQTYVALRRDWPDVVAVPVVEGRVQLKARDDDLPASLTLLGVDPFAEAPVRAYAGVGTAGAGIVSLLQVPNAVLVSAALAARLQLPQNLQASSPATLEVIHAGETHRLPVVGVLTADSEEQNQAMVSLLIADIASAQQLFGMKGKLSRIDLALSEGQYEALRKWLPNDTQLVAAGSQQAAQREMTRAFETNLIALSLLALLVGGFLIYNAMTFSVVRRRSQFGILRTVGMTKGDIVLTVLQEAVVIGVMASVLGLIMGWLLAHGLLALVVTTINDLYYQLEVTNVEVGAPTIALAFALGIGVSVVAALVPANEASRVTPRIAMSRRTLEANVADRDVMLMLVGLGLVLFGVVLLMLPESLPGATTLWPAFIGLFLIMIGVACCVPWLMQLILPLLASLLVRAAPTEGPHACRAILRSRSRTAVAIAALAVAVSATLGVSLMISSFRLAVEDWLETYLIADVYVTRAGSGAALTDTFVERLRGLDDVTQVNLGRWTRIATESEPVQLFALETDRESFQAFQFIAGNADTIWPTYTEGESVIVTEPFASHRELAVDDHITLLTANGEKRYRIAGIYRDYGSDRGLVTMYRSVYARDFADDTVTSAAIFVRDGVNADALMAKVLALDKSIDDLQLRANQDLRDASLVVFDRTFAVTGVIRTLAVVVALIGIIVALMSIQYERANEFALLRAIGMLPSGLWRLILMETGIMGLVSALIALPLGIATAWILVLVINQRAFGWSMDFSIDAGVLLESIGLALLAALLAGILPALKLVRTPPAQALRYE